MKKIRDTIRLSVFFHVKRYKYTIDCDVLWLCTVHNFDFGIQSNTARTRQIQPNAAWIEKKKTQPRKYVLYDNRNI